MQLYIADKIKKYRKENKWSQKELAEKLNISSQAISRWETNMAFPDIELLPEMAILFGITVDELLGVEKLLNNDKINSLIEKANSYYQTGDIQKAVDILEQARKDNPANINIIKHLIYILYTFTYSDNRKKICERIISLGTKIVDQFNNIDDKCSIYQIMAYIYLELGETEKAKMCAEKLPKIDYVSDFILVSILEGNQKTKIIQENINNVFTILINQINHLLKTNDYSEDEKITILNKSNDLIRLIYEENDYDYENWFLARNNMLLTELYANKKDEKNTCKYLSEALKYASGFDKLSKVLKNTSLLKNRLEFNKEKQFGKSYTQSEVELLLDNLNDKKFDFVRENKNFKEIISNY